IEQGKLRVLATTGPARPATYPQLPTLGELGFDKANLVSMFGFYAPSNTPPEVVERFNQEVQRLLATSDMQQRLRKLDNTPHPMSVEDFTAAIRRDYALNGVLIEKAGIKAQ